MRTIAVNNQIDAIIELHLFYQNHFEFAFGILQQMMTSNDGNWL